MHPVPNVVVAFSFTPQPVSTSLEHKVPSMNKRVNAICELQGRGQ